MNEPIKSLFWRKVLRMFGMDRWFRVHDQKLREDLACAWCKDTTRTTVGEVWCEANPVGYLVRVCDNCTRGCA